MASLQIGVILPRPNGDPTATASAARLAESLGLESVWSGDHLDAGGPILESTTALATAAAVTTRVKVGYSVLVLAAQPLAWQAKRIGSLQYLSGSRLLLGVGVGGPGPAWAAAGVPVGERGRRTDAGLAALPAMLAGTPVDVGAEKLTLSPAVPMPPVLVGGGSEAAIRRAARYGDAWFPSVVTPSFVAAGALRLAEIAAGLDRPVPSITVGGAVALGSGDGVPTREDLARQLTAVYGHDPAVAAQIPITGTPAEAAERFAAYAAAGAERLVLGISGGDWRRQAELIATTRALLD